MKKALTLVELMVAVSVLSIGIVVVLQSRLGIVSAVAVVESQMLVLQILEKKMNDLELLSINDAGIEEQAIHEDIQVGKHPGKYQLTVRPVSINIEEESSGESLNLLEAHVQLTWEQEMAVKKLDWSTFLPLKTE